MQRLLNFMIALRRMPPLSELSGDEERLLFEIRQAWEYNGSVSVSDVYAMVQSKSASTAYRTALSLKEKGLIDFEIDPADRRRREIRFTSKADYLFNSIK